MISVLKFSLTILLSVLLISTPQQSVEAKKWRDVDLSETPLIFKNWPNSEDCRLRQRMAADYSNETTLVECPKIPFYPFRENPVTLVRVSELMPGYYWVGAGGKDIRDNRIFKYGKFSGAKFDPGQEFFCDQDTSCARRTITFKVGDSPCQVVNIIPGVGGQSDFWGQTDSKLSLLLIHCGTDKPLTNEHIVYTEDEKIKLIYPGGNQSINKPKVERSSVSDCPDGSIDNGKGQCVFGSKDETYFYKFGNRHSCSTTYIPGNTSKQVCEMALNSSKTDWQKGVYPFELPCYIAEAKKRFPNSPLKECQRLVDASVPKKSEIISDGNGNIADRLKALKKLEDAGLITKEEAGAKRKEILKNL